MALLHATSDAKRDAKDRLRKLRPAPVWVVEALVYRLQHVDPDVRYLAAKTMGIVVGSGQRHVAPLVRAVADDDSLVRMAAVGSFAELLYRGLHRRDAKVKRALVAALADSDSDVREWAAMACEFLGPMTSGDAPRYFAVAKDQDTDVREAGFRLLASTAKGNSEVERILVSALRDDEPRLRGAAAKALGDFQIEKATEPVVTALTDALIRETDRDAASSMDLALAYIAHRHCEIIAKRLKGASTATTLRLLEVLWRLFAPTSEARALVTPLLKSSEPRVRAGVAKVLEAWPELPSGTK